MPTYEYVCPACGSRYVHRDMPPDCGAITCDACNTDAPRVPFYLDTAITGLPTRGPLIPARPKPRSTAKENADNWLDMTHEEAYRQHEWSKRYGRGGEYARDFDDRPATKREA